MTATDRTDERRHDTATGDGHRALAPDAGERLRFLGASEMRIKHDGGPASSVFYEYVSEPGVAGAPQHVHHGHDETFYIVEGVYEFIIGAEHVTLAPGGFLYVPRSTPHTFRNAGDRPGRIVGTFHPGRFVNYFRELADAITADGSAPDRDAWSELYARYDTTFADEY